MNREGPKFETLIVGAGVAGLTLAALLEQRGEKPIVIEKQTERDFQDAGYMLGLLPLGGRVLNALNKQTEYLEESCSMETYNIHDGHGVRLNSYPLTKINERFGPYRGISRGTLINLLRESAENFPIHFETTIEEITQSNSSVSVSFDDGSAREFDLVVIADGLHSETKLQILDKQEFSYKQTGWGGWVTWIESHPDFANAYNEFWGAGTFLGLYPVKDRIGAFLGGPVKQVQQIGLKRYAEQVESNMKHPIAPVRDALTSFKSKEDPYFWNFHDCRTQRWREGRVILLGDAATGFLPTAGVGASMAMDSAAALDDELSRADNQHLEYALDLFEKRQKERVEKAQKESRDLGNWMFVNSSLMAWVRDKMLNFYSLDMMLQGLEDIMMAK